MDAVKVINNNPIRKTCMVPMISARLFYVRLIQIFDVPELCDGAVIKITENQVKIFIPYAKFTLYSGFPLWYLFSRTTTNISINFILVEVNCALVENKCDGRPFVGLVRHRYPWRTSKYIKVSAEISVHVFVYCCAIQNDVTTVNIYELSRQ